MRAIPCAPIHNPEGVADSTRIGYNQAVETEHALYVSGQPGWDASADVAEGIEAQTRLAWDNVEAVLAEAGLELTDVAKVTGYLVDPDEHLEPFLEVWNDRLAEPRPASTIVGVESLALPSFLVELDVEVPLEG
ncbi:MAG: Rid family hydrolase [Halobacteriales archaeon]|nr:Rid family hydrolase [Halobacteriales archaeon]